MSGRKIKALVLSISLLVLIIIIYSVSRRLSKPESEGEPRRTAATVVREFVIATGEFFSDRAEDVHNFIETKKAEHAAKIAAKEAEKEAKYLAEATSTEYINSHMEGDVNVVEVKTEETVEEVVPESTLLTTENGDRYLSVVAAGDAPGVAVYRYVRIPSEPDGVSFRAVNDWVYAIEEVKFYSDPMLEGEVAMTSIAWQGFTRLGISKDCRYQLLTGDERVLYADGRLFRRNREDMPLTEDIVMDEERVKLPVKHLSQNPSLPNGCEITSLATVLNYLEFDITKEKLSDYYLPKAPVGEANYFEEFVGNPRSTYAYGCYAAPIIDAANEYLKVSGSSLKAVDYTGSSFRSLLLKVREGKPVIVWATSYMNVEPEITAEWIVDGEYLPWKGNLHCMVLIGYDILQGKVIVSDPLRNIEEYDMTTFIKRFKQFYSQAIVIE